jgi:Ferritin-like
MSANIRRDRPRWDIESLRTHLQGAVDLEFWTIPYYMTVLYSIKDPSCEAYRLIQAACYQEMLHAQLACNIANAFGYSPRFTAPAYTADKIPHIDFRLDVPNPTEIFTPFSGELGPLDQKRLNTMCLVEYPEWDTERSPDLRPKQSEYGSIGEFYDAVRVGIYELRHELRGGVKQVSEFGPFYNAFSEPAITRDGEEGVNQALRLVQVIVDQGEGQTSGDADVRLEYQATTDGFENSWPHYRKFLFVRAMRELPETWVGAPDPAPGSEGRKAQEILIKDFAGFMETLNALFSGAQPVKFGAQMAKLGGDIVTCWKRGAIPRFS